MPLAYLFWTIYVVAIVFGFWGYYEAGQPNWFRRGFGFAVIWILVGVLGWHDFGPILK